MSGFTPWPAGEPCPLEGCAAFADALKRASFHFADDTGKEWDKARRLMNEAATVAIDAKWPYWTIQRMYREIAPLMTLDNFMDAYCGLLLAKTEGDTQ